MGEQKMFNPGKMKLKVNVGGVSKDIPQGELTRIVLGQDENGGDILGGYYTDYNEDMTPDLIVYEANTKAKELKDVNASYETQIEKLVSGVPMSDRLSWVKQEEQARAYKIDPTGDYVLIRSLADARGVDIEVLVDKIIAKADAYEVALGTLMGSRQKQEDELGV